MEVRKRVKELLKLKKILLSLSILSAIALTGCTAPTQNLFPNPFDPMIKLMKLVVIALGLLIILLFVMYILFLRR